MTFAKPYDVTILTSTKQKRNIAYEDFCLRPNGALAKKTSFVYMEDYVASEVASLCQKIRRHDGNQRFIAQTYDSQRDTTTNNGKM